MPVFTFTGKDAQGKKVSGEKMADTKAQVTMQLRRDRITPAAIKQKGKEFALPTFGTGKVPTKELAVFFRQFSVMIDAGLPLVQCLEILAANQENQTFQKCLTAVRTTVEGGATLSNAMRQHPKIFDDLTTNMIEAGETGGILDTILQRLALYVEKNVKLKSAVKSALIYPVSVISIAALVVGCLLKFVVPIFANMFASMDVTLPLPYSHPIQQSRKKLLVVAVCCRDRLGRGNQVHQERSPRPICSGQVPAQPVGARPGAA
jgi:type IV pilus assembly protein PilC